MCVIADDSGVLGLGGILGGEDTLAAPKRPPMCFMECAWFDPRSRSPRPGARPASSRTRATAWSASSTRPSSEPGLELATRLVLEMCGGEPCEIRVAGGIEAPDTVIDFPLAKSSA